MKNKKQINKICKVVIGFIIISSVIVTPMIVGVGVTMFPYVSDINGDSNAWIGFWGSYIGGIIGTLGVIYVAFIQNKSQIHQLNVELNQMKQENNKTRELDKLKHKQDIIKEYLIGLIEYRKLFLNKAMQANNKLYLLSFYKDDESYWAESDETNKNSLVSILLDDYEEIDNLYSSLKMMHNNFVIFSNSEKYKLNRLSNGYIQLLNQINLQSFKSEFRSSINYEKKLIILNDHLNEIDNVYNYVSDLLRELISEYNKL